MSDSREYLVDFRNYRDWTSSGEPKTLVFPEVGIVHHYSAIDFRKTVGFANGRLALMTIDILNHPDYDDLAIMVKMLDRENPSRPMMFALDHDGVVTSNCWDAEVFYEEELFAQFILMPSYVAATTIKIIKKRTLQKVKRRDGSKKRSYQSRYKIIRSVKRVYIGPRTRSEPTGRHYDHQIPVQGYWRKVKGIGKDADGSPVVGKTWVHPFVRCKDKPAREIIYVKEPLELK